MIALVLKPTDVVVCANGLAGNIICCPTIFPFVGSRRTAVAPTPTAARFATELASISAIAIVILPMPVNIEDVPPRALLPA